ncbi:MAG: hypothetical protein JW871_07965 [Endomicrobiales bacterium]|nr:hypothetical protein [Endomicrobiales bacterium]
MKTTKTTFLLLVISTLTKPLNFIKEIIIAAIFGSGINRDAFLIAWQIPNIVGSFIFEGLPQIFVPFLAEIRKSDDYEKVISSLLNFIFIILAIISLTVIFSSSFLVSLIAPFASPEMKIISSKLLKIMGFSVLFIGISMAFTGLLYSYNKLIIPNMTIPFMNLIIIVVILFGAKNWGIYSLAFGVLVGSLGMVLVQLFQIKEIKYRFKIEFSPSFKKFFIFGSTFFAATLIFNLNAISEKIFASRLPAGSISNLDYAFRITQLVFAILSMMSISIFPRLCNASSSEDESNSEFTTLLAKGIRSIIFLILPIIAVLFALKLPIVSIIYQRGAFSEQAALITSSLMGIYSFGLFFHSINFLLIHAFYARKEMIIRVKYGLIYLSSFIIVNLVFINTLGVYTLAIANSFAALISTFYLSVVIVKRITLPVFDIFKTFLKLSITSSLIGFISLKIWNLLNTEIPLLIALTISLLAAFICFLILVFLFKIEEIKYAKELIPEIINKWKKSKYQQ